MRSYKAHFQKFLSADPKRIHFAAHSHHYWPDVSFDAHVKAWTDAATLADDKWDRVFGKLYPRCQRHVARVLRLPDPSTIAFAPNTHELVMRVFSCLPSRMFWASGHDREPLRVLTTDGEFHSFARQLARFEEEKIVQVVRVPTRPFDTFVQRFTAAARKDFFALVYLSQVFFDSGWALRDLDWLEHLAEQVIVIDGYHAFSAIDVDLSKLASRIFYVAGGYKYAMSGEGACFLHAPPGQFPRPVDTGWFAAFFAMEEKQAGVPYAEDGSRFLGATFDPSGLYRFDAVMSWLEREGVTARDVDERAKALQALFLEEARDLPLGELLATDDRRGSFLAFESARAKELHDLFASRNVVTDVRGDRLRIGFGLYHDESDVLEGVRRMTEALG